MEWKSEGVMDAESGDDDKDVLRTEWGGESKQDWQGWRNEFGSWFHSERDVYCMYMSVEFYLYPTVGTVLIYSVKPELTE